MMQTQSEALKRWWRQLLGTCRLVLNSLIWGRGSGAAAPTDGKHVAPVSTRGHGDMEPWVRWSLHLPGLTPALGLERGHLLPHTEKCSAQQERQTRQAETAQRERPWRANVGLRMAPTALRPEDPDRRRGWSPRKQRPRCGRRPTPRGGGQERMWGLAFTGQEFRRCSFRRSRITALLLYYLLLAVCLGMNLLYFEAIFLSKWKKSLFEKSVS